MNLKIFALAIVLLLGTFSQDVSADWLTDISNMVHTKCFFASGFFQTFAIFRPSVYNVHFTWMTPCKDNQVVINAADKIPAMPGFNPNKKTVFFITGWQTTRATAVVNEMASNYKCRDAYNFVYVDTGLWMKNEYIFSSMITEDIGKAVAKGIQKMGIPADKIHLIGHSLGAHTAAQAGRQFFKFTGKKVARITGLDPARPCFKNPQVFASLARGDAEFVDVIHSNVGRLGTELDIGDVDFYPTGLEPIQPGCGISDDCSHSRSLDYFMESARIGGKLNFQAKKCNSLAELEQKSCDGPETTMGFGADTTVRGIYYLKVNAQSPYGLNAKNTQAAECKCTA